MTARMTQAFDYAIGDWVEIVGPGNDNLVGQVNGCCVEGVAHVTYRVVWWIGRDRRQEWLTAAELIPLRKAGA